jgi:hypothetical protein
MSESFPYRLPDLGVKVSTSSPTGQHLAYTLYCHVKWVADLQASLPVA